MLTVREWIVRVGGSFRRNRSDQDLEEELRLHIEMAAEDAQRRSDSPRDARRAAIIRVGGVAHSIEALRDQRGFPWLEEVWRMTLTRDVRHAWRMWLAYPLLTSAAILSLALGMDANTAVFSVMNALLFKSSPVSDPGTLAAVYSTRPVNPGWHPTAFKNFEDLRDALPFGMIASASIPLGFAAIGNQPEQAQAELVSGNYFALLGVSAALGRVFTFNSAEDKIADKHPVIVISDAFWKRRFGGRPDVVNEAVQLNARPFTIVGVAPPGFLGLDVMRSVDIWVPSLNVSVLTGVDGFYFRQRQIGMFDVVARATPEVGLPQVQSMLQARSIKLAQTFPQEDKGLGIATRPFWQSRMKPAQREAWRSP